MSRQQASAGLGIELSNARDHRDSRMTASAARSGPSQNDYAQHHLSYHAGRPSQFHEASKQKHVRIHPAISEPQELHASAFREPALVSAKSANGVAQQARDPGARGKQKSQHAAQENMPYFVSASSPRTQERRRRAYAANALARHGTLLSRTADPGQNAAELKFLLGNTKSRLKHGAVVLPESVQRSPDKKTRKAQGVPLEQAMSRARVEVDITLENNTCVQGEYLRGHVIIRVRESTKKEAPVLLADGKVRVIGFECVPNEDYRHTFYQCGSALSAITSSSASLYESPPDTEGFAQAKEGAHTLPFAMHLSLSGSTGTAKGAINIYSGVAVRYIAMMYATIPSSHTNITFN